MICMLNVRCALTQSIQSIIKVMFCVVNVTSFVTMPTQKVIFCVHNVASQALNCTRTITYKWLYEGIQGIVEL